MRGTLSLNFSEYVRLKIFISSQLSTKQAEIKLIKNNSRSHLNQSSDISIYSTCNTFKTATTANLVINKILFFFYFIL